MTKCEFCKKKFKTGYHHICPKKQRWTERDTQHAKLALTLYNKWRFENTAARSEISFREFIDCTYYTAFVGFAYYVLDARIFSPDRYMKWLTKNNIKIDDWRKDSVYSRYLAEESKKETAERAVERFVIYAEKWSETTGYHWSDYWHRTSDSRIFHDIQLGKISPWIFLGNEKAVSRIVSMSDDYLDKISNSIDLTYWKKKINQSSEDIAWLNSLF
jgi:hypothetical protein